MALSEYSRKRKNTTPEPEAKIRESSGERIFVVQKHNASHLHYDLRLEIGGVLKSWAVPKGPSLNPTDKRLAMMVEDHPLAYQDFEGIIPAGSYGAGSVIVWDWGTYTPLDSGADPDQLAMSGIEKGKLSFILDGQKLKGEFTLARIKSAEENNSWLLIKKNDSNASREDVRLKDESVVTGKTIEDWEMGESELELDEVRAVPPDFVSPMLAKLADHPFDRTDWIFEIKWDGYRTIADIRENTAKIYSRHQNSYDELFPEVLVALKTINRKVVLDGEIVVLDENGKAQFGLIQDYKKHRNGILVYYVFDLLFLDDVDLRDLPLRNRRELLERLFSIEKIPDTIKLSQYVEEKGTSFFELVKENDLEGMVAKNLNSIYKSGKRSDDWLKIKYDNTAEAIICGYTEGRGGRRLGALVLGIYQDKNLKYIGHTGTGFSVELEKQLLTKLAMAEVKESPFLKPPKTNAPVHWVKPELICEVKFTEWTRDDVMRNPIFKSLKTDREVGEVTKEEAIEPPEIELLKDYNSKDKVTKVDGQKITIVNYRKKLWSEEGISKMDLVEYYRAVSPVILPHLRDRPESLHRFPHGIETEGFYQKNTSDLNLPFYVESVEISSDTEEKNTQYLLCQNEPTLVYLANLGCIELNPWSSRVGNLENPDFLVIDLDPLNVAFAEVVKVAKECKKLFDRLKIPSHCKTSGATGLHVYVPLGAKYSYEEARMFSEIVANYLHKALPKITSVDRSPTKRDKKIYLDFLQNRRGQTLAAPYSVRPLPGAPVSAPLSWDELNTEGLDPLDFTIKNMPERIKRVGDLWAPILTESADIMAGLAKLNEKK